MTITQIRYFLEIASTGHFSSAADNLYISQSTLSYGIKELEKELGAELFVRHANKKVSLSEAGQRFLAYADKALALLNNGKNEIAQMKNPLAGEIKIGVFFSTALTVLPYLIDKFEKAYPDNKIRFDFEVNHHWINMNEMMSKGIYDFSITVTHENPDLNNIRVGQQRIIAIVPLRHPLSFRNRLSAEDLKDETIIAIDPKSNLDHFIFDFFNNNGLEPKMKYVADWTAQIVTSSLENRIAISSDYPIDEKLFKKIPLDIPKDSLDLYLCWSKSKELSPSAKLFTDFFRNMQVSNIY